MMAPNHPPVFPDLSSVETVKNLVRDLTALNEMCEPALEVKTEVANRHSVHYLGPKRVRHPGVLTVDVTKTVNSRGANSSFITDEVLPGLLRNPRIGCLGLAERLRGSGCSAALSVSAKEFHRKPPTAGPVCRRA